MRNLKIVLVTTLLAAATAQAGEAPRVRYQDPSGRTSVTVTHDMYVAGMKEPIANRRFSFDLTQSVDGATEAVTVTIDQAKGSYSAHGHKQRLGTRHLTGRSFLLAIGNDGRQLDQAKASEAPIIDVGPPVEDGFSVAALLAETLPILPEGALSVGTTWTTERPVRSLEGWAWGNGRMTSRHRVTAVDRRDGHAVVTVATEAKASLGPLKSERAFSGDLKRTLHWTFDANDGRLLSLSMEQESSGTCPLPQGETAIRQQTTVELTPLGSEKASR